MLGFHASPAPSAHQSAKNQIRQILINPSRSPMIRAANFGKMNRSLPSVITAMMMVHRVRWVMSRTRRGAAAVAHGRACLERRRATGPSRLLLTHLQSTDLTTTAAGRSQAAVPTQIRREVGYPSSDSCTKVTNHVSRGGERRTQAVPSSCPARPSIIVRRGAATAAPAAAMPTCVRVGSKRLGCSARLAHLSNVN